MSAEFVQLIRVDGALNADDGQLLRFGHQNRESADLAALRFQVHFGIVAGLWLRTPTIRDQAGAWSCARNRLDVGLLIFSGLLEFEALDVNAFQAADQLLDLGVIRILVREKPAGRAEAGSRPW